MMAETSVERAYRIECERDAAVRKIDCINRELRSVRDDYAPDAPPYDVETLIVNIETILGAR